MMRAEIEAALAAGASKEVCVARGPAPGIAGYTRTVTVHSGNRLQVAFEVDGLDEGGAYFWGTFASFDRLVTALEGFLDARIESWKPSDVGGAAGATPDHEALAEAIRRGEVHLPGGCTFVLRSSYWEQFAPPEQLSPCAPEKSAENSLHSARMDLTVERGAKLE